MVFDVHTYLGLGIFPAPTDASRGSAPTALATAIRWAAYYY